MDDWEYNLKAMVAGIDTSQAIETNKFIKDAKNKFGITEDRTEVIGLSHSLAHNNNTTAHILNREFDKIYSVNGAQTNYFQLYQGYIPFQTAVSSRFKIDITDTNAIYELDQQL